MVGAMLVRLFVFAAILAFAGVPAWAHSPYFTQIEKIDLPDGTEGELRLLHGDGILVGDPVRIIAIDSQERLLARSEHGAVAHILCGQAGRCNAYIDDRILELAPGAEPGPVIAKALREYGSDERYALEASTQSFGFSARAPSFKESITVSLGVAKRFPLLTLFHFALGALLILSIAGLVVGPLKHAGRMWIVLGILMALIVVALLAVMSVLLMLIVTFPDLLWLGSIGLGAMFGLILLRIAWRKPHPA